LPSKYWDKAKQKVKPTYPLHFEYNRFLSNFVNLVTKKTLDFLATNPKPTHHQFKDFWKQIKNTNNGNAFFEVFDVYIKDKTIAPGTKVKYKTIWKQLKAFDPNLTFDDIDLEFADAFTNYLIDKGLTDNTIHKTFEFLKTFMRWAKERGYHQNEEFSKIRHKATIPDLIALTSEEFERIRTLELPPSLARYRDFFVFQCLTGQRFSDYSKFSLDDVKGNIWYLRQKKTREPLQIPLVEPALDILRRYKFVPFFLRDTLTTNWFKVKELSNLNVYWHGVNNNQANFYIQRQSDKRLIRLNLYDNPATKIKRNKFVLANPNPDEKYRFVLAKTSSDFNFCQKILFMPSFFEDEDFYRQAGEPQIIDLGETDLLTQGLQVSVFPNPSNHLIYLKATLNTSLAGLTNQQIFITFYNSIGEKVYSLACLPGVTVQLSTEDWSSGIYFIVARCCTENQPNVTFTTFFILTKM
jgi:hypothetical protein